MITMTVTVPHGLSGGSVSTPPLHTQSARAVSALLRDFTLASPLPLFANAVNMQVDTAHGLMDVQIPPDVNAGEQFDFDVLVPDVAPVPQREPVVARPIVAPVVAPVMTGVVAPAVVPVVAPAVTPVTPVVTPVMAPVAPMTAPAPLHDNEGARVLLCGRACPCPFCHTSNHRFA